MIKRNAFREKYGKMTDEQLAEYQTIIDLGCESEYWKDKLDGAIISFIGCMGFLGYLLAAVNPNLLIAAGIVAGTVLLRKVTKLRLVEVAEE